MPRYLQFMAVGADLSRPSNITYGNQTMLIRLLFGAGQNPQIKIESGYENRQMRMGPRAFRGLRDPAMI